MKKRGGRGRKEREERASSSLAVRSSASFLFLLVEGDMRKETIKNGEIRALRTATKTSESHMVVKGRKRTLTISTSSSLSTQPRPSLPFSFPRTKIISLSRMVTPTGTSSRGEEGSVDLVKVYTEALAQEVSLVELSPSFLSFPSPLLCKI